jgi:hypothetical protein
MNKNRREFLKLTGMAGLALGITGIKPSLNGTKLYIPGNEIRFMSPVDGDMLTEYDGSLSGGTLAIKVKVAAPAGSRIRVNGIPAMYIDGLFQTDITLNNYENILELVEEKAGYRESIKVFRLNNYANKYRFSFDDNILFLKDISLNSGRYKSIFENPYLACLKKVHDTLGTKIHLNIYYQTEGFNLSQMTDKFRNEWKANAGWMGLSFHALQNSPDMPYLHSGYDQVKKDCVLVQEQIKRFAGEEVMGPETTLHWGEATVEGCRALRDSGYKVLAGYFNVDDDQGPVSYYLTVDQRRHIKKRFIWRDNAEGIIFTRLAAVVNHFKLVSEVVPYLDKVKKIFNPPYIDLMIHEQYFYPQYESFQPNWGEKVMAAAKWAVDNGYKPAFYKECLLK